MCLFLASKGQVHLVSSALSRFQLFSANFAPIRGHALVPHPTPYYVNATTFAFFIFCGRAPHPCHITTSDITTSTRHTDIYILGSTCTRVQSAGPRIVQVCASPINRHYSEHRHYCENADTGSVEKIIGLYSQSGAFFPIVFKVTTNEKHVFLGNTAIFNFATAKTRGIDAEREKEK